MRPEVARRLLDGFGELGDARLGEFARAFEIGPGGVRLLQGGGQALVLLLDGLELPRALAAKAALALNSSSSFA